MALELLLAVDASTSVDAREFRLQRDGLAQAFVSEEVLRAIASAGPRGIAVALMEWAGPRQQEIVVDWTHITDETDARAFAARLRAAPRVVSGFTDIRTAIDVARIEIARNAFEGARKVIDVSGDGTASNGSPDAARDRALAQGMTINGLVIYSQEYDLGDLANMAILAHYRFRVIGGPGAFIEVAEDFEDFARAIRRKLLREIGGFLLGEIRLPPR